MKYSVRHMFDDKLNVIIDHCKISLHNCDIVKDADNENLALFKFTNGDHPRFWASVNFESDTWKLDEEIILDGFEIFHEFEIVVSGCKRNFVLFFGYMGGIILVEKSALKVLGV